MSKRRNTTNTALLQHQWELWFQQYPSEGFATIRLKPNLLLQDAHGLFIREIIRPLAKSLKTAIGAISIITRGIETNHMHSFLIPFHKGTIQNNMESIQVLLANQCGILNDHERALDIRPIHEGHCRYGARHIKDDTLVEFYGQAILETKRLVHPGEAGSPGKAQERH